MDAPHFLYSVGDGYVSCFFFGTVVNNAAVSICAQALMGEMFLFLESIHLRVGWLGHMVSLC